MLHCPATPPNFACCVVFKVCALSAHVCTFLLYLLCLHMHMDLWHRVVDLMIVRKSWLL